MNHDKATPRPWVKREPKDGRGSIEIASRDIIYTGAVTGALVAKLKGPSARMDADLINAAVNAWDDPAALRDRLKELEGNNGDA